MLSADKLSARLTCRSGMLIAPRASFTLDRFATNFAVQQVQHQENFQLKVLSG